MPSSASAQASASSAPESQPALDSHLCLHNRRPSLSFVATAQRIRKRVPWRGKTCIISLPITSSSAGSQGYKYLKPREVEKIVHKSRGQGYDTGGFRLGPEYGTDQDTPDYQAQSRAPFPDPEVIFSERATRLFRVRIPDQAQWNSYVDGLKEAKLRALGVTSSNEESQSHDSPVVPSLNSHPVPQASSLPISPSFVRPHSTGFGTKHTSEVPLPFQGVPGSSSCLPPAMVLENRPISSPGGRRFPRYSIAQPQMSPDLSLPNLPALSFPPDSRLGMRRYYAASQSSPRITSPAFQGAPQGFADATGSRSLPTRQLAGSASAHSAMIPQFVQTSLSLLN